MRKKVFIIAEIGVNHNGNLKLATKMVDAAIKAGADAVKFQAFKAEDLTGLFAPKADYQIKNTGRKESQLKMLKRLELKASDFRRLSDYCGKKKIDFILSPFDLSSIDLVRQLKLRIIKIPSGEITNLPYLEKIGKMKKKIILSTGMADMKEINFALKTLVSSGTPKNNITILHCTTEYPASIEDVNLKAMDTIRKVFRVNVGYSDHTQGIEVSVAAVAMGATVIEKHFTLDKKDKGPDHKASLGVFEFRNMVRAIRNIEKALGNGIKKPTFSEGKNKIIVRKSIVALKDIKKGDRFTEKNITSKRPGTGISPMRWYDIAGKRAKKNFKKDELIKI